MAGLENYDARLEAKIRHKARSLMRTSLRQGEQEARVPATEFSQRFEQSVGSLRASKIDYVINRAEVLITEALAQDPSIIVAMVHKLFRNIAEHTDVEIAAHPEDIAHIKAALSEDAHAHTAVRKVLFQEDDGVIRGSLVLKANKSIIDAQIKTQLERARSIIAQRLESKHG